ncbi:MAG TPA: ATP-dependent acyl-CoA ligase [Chloroflexota bacterium]|nr:ATP-dependent acyl-CoA ligase [Chloroflexota bacterium]
MSENLWTFLEGHAGQTPEKTLARYRDGEESYAGFVASAERAANALYGLGVRDGDNVCVMLGNHPDHLHVWFGLARLGAVAVPINVHLKGEGLGYILEHSEAKLSIVEAELVERVLALPSLPPALATIAVRGGAPPARRCLDWGALAAAAWPASPPAATPPEAVAAILYTSGTTGPSKGVMLSHAAYLNSARAFAEEMVHATPDDVFFTTLPLFHINAQAHTVLPAIYLNATLAISPRFSASGFWEEIRRSRATIFNSLAAMLPILCKQPPSPDDRRHGARLTACAATPRDVWLQFEERFGVTIVEGYGLTETAGFCVTNPLDEIRVGSIGKAMSWVETRVVDAADREKPIGEVGEIAIRPRAPHVLMEGYYKMPEQTAETMRGGWFHSGDAGFADADGYLGFVDRIKQSIRRRGENVSSWEVEKIVNAHPKVLESAAVGVPSELGEEDVKICVVARPGETIDPLEIVQWCETRMAYFMVPRYVAQYESLPKTATERVEKYKLKQEGVAEAWDREVAGYRVRRSS